MTIGTTASTRTIGDDATMILASTDPVVWSNGDIDMLSDATLTIQPQAELRLEHDGDIDVLGTAHQGQLIDVQGTFRKTGSEAAIEDVYQQTLDWLATEVTGYRRWERLLTEMEARVSLDLAVFLVAVRALGRLNAVSQKAA